MKLRITVIFCLIYGLYGCTGYQQVACPQYVTETTEKGQLFTNVGLLYFQLGYNLKNHFNLFVLGNKHIYSNNDLPSGSKSDNGSFSGPNSYDRDITQMSLGFGYFPNELTFFKNRLHYGIQFGIGKGTLSYSHDRNNIGMFAYSDKFKYNAKSYNEFIQPIIGIKMNKFFVALTSILNNCNYFDITSKGTPLNDSDKVFATRKNIHTISWESGVFLQVGGKYVKFQSQFLFPYELTSTGIAYRTINVVLGLNLNLNIFHFLDKVVPKE